MICSILLGWFGAPELIVIAAVVLLLFGGKKLPELMKGMGQGISNFKKGMSGEEDAKKPSDEKKGELEK